MIDTQKSARIALLNDALRTTFYGGTVRVTAGVVNLPEEEHCAVLEAIRGFNDFKPENDPYGEHDFGSVKLNNTLYYFKIDYYDSSLMYASEDPSNPVITRRVLTIMLAEEY